MKIQYDQIAEEMWPTVCDNVVQKDFTLDMKIHTDTLKK